MKRLILLGILGVIGWMPFQAKAQLSINVNIGSQPLWGPVGYDYVDYYYLPDMECYYHVPARQFIYLEGSRWRFSASLPSRYRGYNLDNCYKVVVNSRDPYRYFDRDRVAYARYRGMRNQQVIRYSNDSRYYVIKGHSHYGRPDRRDYHRDHDRWDNDRGHGGRDYDRGDHRDRGERSDWNKGRGRGGDRGDHGGHGRGHGRERG
uniref:hypothetical protein n=1 Tax=Pedobacter schmidteae TaxID=2201271 RepID=UPI0018D58677|nr:hypothetical protein [Pedobacter schmidteae]